MSIHANSRHSFTPKSQSSQHTHLVNVGLLDFHFLWTGARGVKEEAMVLHHAGGLQQAGDTQRCPHKGLLVLQAAVWVLRLNVLHQHLGDGKERPPP